MFSCFHVLHEFVRSLIITAPLVPGRQNNLTSLCWGESLYTRHTGTLTHIDVLVGAHMHTCTQRCVCMHNFVGLGFSHKEEELLNTRNDGILALPLTVTLNQKL